MRSARRVRRQLLLATLILGLSPVAQADLPASVARLKPSVLLIGTYAATDSPRFAFRGSGFVVGAGNLAITNAHVLPETLVGEGGRQIAVQAWRAPNQWQLRLAKVLVMDRDHDLALLSFEGPAVTAVELSQTRPSEGAGVAFMGFPLGGALGFSHVTHRGIISSIAAMALPAPTARQLNERALLQMRAGGFEIFQLDGTAYPGNSGGPMFEPETGAVVGVINSVLVKGSRESALSQPSGISYGIPVEHVQRLLQQALR